MPTGPNYRKPAEVKQISLRMSKDHIARLAHLSKANHRSRRVLLETLIDEAFLELQDNPDARINPVAGG